MCIRAKTGPFSRDLSISIYINNNNNNNILYGLRLCSQGLDSCLHEIVGSISSPRTLQPAELVLFSTSSERESGIPVLSSILSGSTEILL
jgi:hypothetical protein